MLAGMFTLTSEIMSANKLLATSIRPSLVPYRSALVEFVSNLVWMLPLISGLASGLAGYESCHRMCASQI